MTTSDYQQLQENFEPAKLIEEVLRYIKIFRKSLGYYPQFPLIWKLPAKK